MGWRHQLGLYATSGPLCGCPWGWQGLSPHRGVCSRSHLPGFFQGSPRPLWGQGLACIGPRPGAGPRSAGGMLPSADTAASLQRGEHSAGRGQHLDPCKSQGPRSHLGKKKKKRKYSEFLLKAAEDWVSFICPLLGEGAHGL